RRRPSDRPAGLPQAADRGGGPQPDAQHDMKPDRHDSNGRDDGPRAAGARVPGTLRPAELIIGERTDAHHPPARGGRVSPDRSSPEPGGTVITLPGSAPHA